jgi:plastocyanin
MGWFTRSLLLLGLLVLALAIFYTLSLSTGNIIASKHADGDVRNTTRLEGPNLFKVAIIEFSYAPDRIYINKGDGVVWRNANFVSHTVTSVSNSSTLELDSSELVPGESYTHYFLKEGEYEYFSKGYPSMRGKVIVS